jgi:hypothetical protein
MNQMLSNKVISIIKSYCPINNVYDPSSYSNSMINDTRRDIRQITSRIARVHIQEKVENTDVQNGCAYVVTKFVTVLIVCLGFILN